MTQTTNLNDATLLYEILGKHIPPLSEINGNYPKFIGKIIDNIQVSKDYMAYLNAIQLMTGVTFDVLEKSSSEDILDLFMSGLNEWRILELVEFFREMGYQNG